MRNLLAFLAAAVLTFAAVGWYLDWYKVSSDSGSTGHHNISIDFNKTKIADDVHKGVQKGEEKLQNVLDKSTGTTNDTAKRVETLPTPPTNPAPNKSGS